MLGLFGAFSLGPGFIELPDALFECRYIGVMLFFFFWMFLVITSRAFGVVPFDISDISRLQAIWAGLVSFFVFPVADGTTDFHAVRIPCEIGIGIGIEPTVFVVNC